MSKSIYPSIPAPGNDQASLRASVDAMRQTLTMVIMNAQNPNPNFTPSSASQIFLTRQQFKDSGVVGPAGPPGAQGPPGTSGIPDAPSDANTYGRHQNAWVAIVSGPGGGIADAPSDNTSYVRNDAAWVHIASGDVTTALGYTPYNATNPAGYVNAAGAASAAPVQSVAGRTGAVTLTTADLTDWANATIDSGTF